METTPPNHQYSLGNIGVSAGCRFPQNDEFYWKSLNQQGIHILSILCLFMGKVVFLRNWVQGRQKPLKVYRKALVFQGLAH